MSIDHDDIAAWLATDMDSPRRGRLAGALVFSLALHAGLAGPLFQFLARTPALPVEHVLTVYLSSVDAENESAETVATRAPARVVIERESPPPVAIKPPSLSIPDTQPQPRQPSRSPARVIPQERVKPLESAPVLETAAVQAPIQESVPTMATRPAKQIEDGSGAAEVQPRRMPSIRPVYAPRPTYPRLALRLGLEGEVMLRVWVSPEGVPTTIVVTQSSGHKSLDNAAKQGVQKWRFEIQGGAEDSAGGWVNLPVIFRLE